MGLKGLLNPPTFANTLTTNTFIINDTPRAIAEITVRTRFAA